jgi:hypothetical protein
MQIKKLQIKEKDMQVGDFYLVTVCGSNMRALKYEYREVTEITDDKFQWSRAAKIKNGALARTKNKVTESLRHVEDLIIVWRTV